jgi:beta-glucosidase
LAQARAVLQIWFPGQSMGRALADILFGHVSPSGRLPQTFPKALSDAPAMADYPGENGVMRYGEGINVGHRAYIQHGVEPLFAFGHGLTYATFDYSAPSLIKTEAGLCVELEVQHCGSVPAQETVQIYARFGDEPWPKPAQVLVGFQKVFIEPGASVTVSVPLERSMFHAWDEVRAAWQPITQPATLMVGASATDIRAELALMPKDLAH